MTVEGKVCTKCGEWKPLTEFHANNRRNKSGTAPHCRECDKARKREYKKKNPELLKAQSRAQYAADPVKRLAATRKWALANPEKMREAKRRCRQTVKARLENNVRGYIHKTITKGYKSKPTFDALGYSSAELMSHLESMFVDGMSWENYGGGWHVDHILPLSSFEYETTDDDSFKTAWALSNLQPLWASENISKGNRLNHPSQVALLAANDNIRSSISAAA